MLTLAALAIAVKLLSDVFPLFKRPKERGPPTCTWSTYCSSWRDTRCGSGHCTFHCGLYCEGACAPPGGAAPSLTVIKGGKAP